MSRFSFCMCAFRASDAPSPPVSGTLELKVSKENAHSGTINSVAFSPDGKTIVSGSRDKTIKVWDAGEPFQLFQLPFPRI